jgi:hypothetical protein
VQSHHHQGAHYSCLLKIPWLQPHHHTTVTLASTSNALPDDGVTAPKHVGAVLMSIFM